MITFAAIWIFFGFLAGVMCDSPRWDRCIVLGPLALLATVYHALREWNQRLK